MSRLGKLSEYVTNLEATCGEERDFVVMLKYEKKDEAMKKIMERGKVLKSLSGIAFDISFKDISMRLYKTGKILIKKVKNKREAKKILSDLLL